MPNNEGQVIVRLSLCSKALDGKVSEVAVNKKLKLEFERDNQVALSRDCAARAGRIQGHAQARRSRRQPAARQGQRGEHPDFDLSHRHQRRCQCSLGRRHETARGRSSPSNTRSRRIRNFASIMQRSSNARKPRRSRSVPPASRACGPPARGRRSAPRPAGPGRSGRRNRGRRQAGQGSDAGPRQLIGIDIVLAVDPDAAGFLLRRMVVRVGRCRHDRADHRIERS